MLGAVGTEGADRVVGAVNVSVERGSECAVAGRVGDGLDRKACRWFIVVYYVIHGYIILPG